MEINTTTVRTFTVTLTEAEATQLIDALGDALRLFDDANDTANVILLADLRDAIDNHVFCWSSSGVAFLQHCWRRLYGIIGGRVKHFHKNTT